MRFPLLVGSLIFCLLGIQVDAQEVESTTTTIKTTTVKGGDAPEESKTADEPVKATDYIIQNSFGPSDCKIKSLLKDLKKELMDECKAWKKEQKSDLGEKYNTGTCVPNQESCGAGTYKVLVQGTVHYSR